MDYYYYIIIYFGILLLFIMAQQKQTVVYFMQLVLHKFDFLNAYNMVKSILWFDFKKLKFAYSCV